MSVPIIIFSVDSIRGRIILNTLHFNGFEALLQNRIIHAEEIIRKNTPSIVILDTKDLSPNELDFFRTAYPVLSNSALILLAGPSIMKSLEVPDIKTELCRTDPLDAELITSKVEALLARKSGRAEERNPLQISPKSKTRGLRWESGKVIKTEEQGAVETDKEESGDEDISLEEDLKKFLDLE